MTKIHIQNISFQCYVVRDIGDAIPPTNTPLSDWVGKSCHLAQSYPHGYLDIDILLGLPGLFKILECKRINVLYETYVLIPTKLGAIIFGGHGKVSPTAHLALPSNRELDERLKNFFSIEDKFSGAFECGIYSK